jgi:hypothetical protein
MDKVLVLKVIDRVYNQKIVVILKSRVGKKACVWQQENDCRVGLPNSCLCVGYHGIARILTPNSFIALANLHNIDEIK